jgi:hypothetical protein
VRTLLGEEALPLGLCCSILTIPVQALSSGVPSLQCAPTVISASASTPGAMVRDEGLPNPWPPVSRTQVLGPDKPASVLSDARAATDEGGWGGTSCVCGGRA